MARRPTLTQKRLRLVPLSNRCREESWARLQTGRAETGDPAIAWSAPIQGGRPANEEGIMAKKAKKAKKVKKK